MYSMPVRTVWTFFTSPRDAVAGVHVAERGVLPAGHEHRQVALHRREQPAVLRIDLVGRRQLAAAQHAVEELVREVALAGPVGGDPLLEHRRLDPPHRLFLGDAGVGDAVHVPLEQRLLVGRRQVAVVRHALVVVVRDEVEDVLLEVGAGAADARGPCPGGSSRPARGRARPCSSRRPGSRTSRRRRRDGASGLGRVLEGGGVEVAVVAVDELRDRSGVIAWACSRRVDARGSTAHSTTHAV